jgi:hypothetical protein
MVINSVTKTGFQISRIRRKQLPVKSLDKAYCSRERWRGALPIFLMMMITNQASNMWLYINICYNRNYLYFGFILLPD